VIRTAIAAMSMSVVASGVAIGQDQIESAISGTVQSIDTQSRTVTLDGIMYHLSDRADMGSLQEGSKLNLTCDTKRANCMVVTVGNQNEASPESTAQPSAGSNANDLPSGKAGSDGAIGADKSKGTEGGGSN
jgi:hypothetical protein